MKYCIYSTFDLFLFFTCIYSIFAKKKNKKKTVYQKERLANSNFNMETEFIAELKEMEEESVRNEATIQRMQREKEQLLEEILEAEKQIMLWEKKIQVKIFFFKLKIKF